MKSALFIATAVMLLSACQHGPNAEYKPLLPRVIDMNLGRAIASAPAARSTSVDGSANGSQASRDRGNPSERDLKCQGWGQCESTGG